MITVHKFKYTLHATGKAMVNTTATAACKALVVAEFDAIVEGLHGNIDLWG